MQGGRRSERNVFLHPAHSGRNFACDYVTLLAMTAVDLNLLRALDALLAEGSVASAARRLGLSASAMSRTLARLRAATGDPLLVRAGRGLVPTPRAIELRDRVREAAEEALALLRPAIAGPDLSGLERTFTIRANDGFVETLGARLLAALTEAAPGVRLRFAPKPDKDVRVLREGLVDLEVGVLGKAGPEVRVQALFRDRFVGVVREGHPLLAAGEITPERYAACGHVVASRRGDTNGPVDQALASLGLRRSIVVVVPGFSAALAIAKASDLVALVTASFHNATNESQPEAGLRRSRAFPLPVQTEPITVSQIWHPRLDADPAHRWLRGTLLAVCRE
jgi:DNA-binding transcriptional LysR family regulator